MKIVVTGHLGYIGSHLMKRLPKHTIGLDLKDGNDICTCELPDADVVIHLAAQAGVINSIVNPVETCRTNTYGTVRLWEKYKNTKFIFASTGGAIQDDQTPPYVSPYGLSKFCAEQFVKMCFTNYRILRFANVYGDNSRSVIDAFLKTDKPVIFGDGTETRTFVHVDDLVDGILDSVNWPKGEYYFGSDQNYSLKEIADATGKEVEYRPMRPGELKHSKLENTTIGWKPTINTIGYIYERIKHNNTK